MAFVRVHVPAQHWTAVAKFLRFDAAVNYCSMVTGTHFPEGGADRGWEVVYHLMRQPVTNQAPNTNTVHVAESLRGDDIPLEFEVVLTLPQTETPTVPSVQGIWVGADWNEKETWDLVGIRFEGHENMHRVLNPHDSPEGFHPLQKQHKIRYHDFNEMYDDAQGFGRKPTDEGRVK
jgi:NADH-quinone oxidoreductase subunit C